MKYFIVNGDDFGFSKGVNYGIVDGFRNGILTSTSIMANSNEFNNAVELAKTNANLAIGVHLNLTVGKPLSNNRHLMNNKGVFYYVNELKSGGVYLDPYEVYKEWKMQIEKVLNAGIQIDHLDSHHHIHLLPYLKQVIIVLAREYKVPIRNAVKGHYSSIINGVQCPHIMVDFYNCKELNKEYSYLQRKEIMINYLIEVISKEFKENICVELMTHPAYLDGTLYTKSSMNFSRVLELDVLQDKKLKDFFKERKDIELTNYQKVFCRK